MLIAKLLMEQRSFERAREWIHCIFDPTNTVDSSDPVQARHWRLRPFAELAASRATVSESELAQLRAFLYGGLDSGAEQMRLSLANQVEEWRRNPFNPHAVARL